MTTLSIAPRGPKTQQWEEEKGGGSRAGLLLRITSIETGYGETGCGVFGEGVAWGDLRQA